MKKIFLKILLLFTIVGNSQSLDLLHQLKRGQQRTEKAKSISDAFTTRVNTDTGTSESTKECFEDISYTVDEASIVLKPSAFKASTLYSVAPTNGDGDFTHTRGSPATRVNSFGLIEEMPSNVPRIDFTDASFSEFGTNLILRSEEFDNASWINTANTTTTGNTIISPNRELTADTANDTGSGDDYIIQSITPEGGKTYIASVYFKFGTSNYFTVFLAGLGGTTVTEKVIIKNDGTIFFDGGGAFLSKQSNGWYRVGIPIITDSGNTALQFRIYPAYTDGTSTNRINAATGTQFVWGAQLEEGSVATKYAKTVSTIAHGKLDSECGVLLLEKGSTNLLKQSEDLTTTWTLNGTSSIIANQGISPDGTNNADLLDVIFSGPNRIQQTNFDTSVAIGEVFTVSAFVKSVDINMATIRVIGGGVDDRIRFTFATETTTDDSTSPTAYGFVKYPNSWYRIWITITTTSTANLGVYINGGVSGTQTGTKLLVWGAQAEKIDYLTSYIKTTTTTITRSEDKCNGSGVVGNFNSSEGVLYAEFSALANDLSLRRISISDGTNNNRVHILFNSNSNTLQALSASGGVFQVSITSISDITQQMKVAFRWKLNDYKLYINGVEIGSDTSALVPVASSLDRLDFSSGDLSHRFFGKIKEVRVYKTALTDQQLKYITQNFILFLPLIKRRIKIKQYNKAA